jgi:hypothetical protein
VLETPKPAGEDCQYTALEMLIQSSVDQVRIEVVAWRPGVLRYGSSL